MSVTTCIPCNELERIAFFMSPLPERLRSTLDGFWLSLQMVYGMLLVDGEQTLKEWQNHD